MPALTRPQPDTLRAILYALGANIAITVVKFLGAALTGSGALLAESFHSFADTGNEALLLLGRKQAGAPPSAQHPLGHGRATYFWSFVVAVLLFSVGGILSILEGIQKLRNPADITTPWVAVAIVLFAMLAEGISLSMLLKQVRKVRGEHSLWRWFRETRRSELIVVLSEDLAAIAGLSLALAALLATIATGDALYDALGSIGIGALLMLVATGLGIETKSLLIGESASPRLRRAISEFVEAQPGVVELWQLVTMQYGEDLFLAVQARMNAALTGRDLVQAIAQCKAATRAQFPQVRWIFLEPVDATSRKGLRARVRLRSRLRHSHSD